jgi:hypothetical protein
MRRGSCPRDVPWRIVPEKNCGCLPGSKQELLAGIKLEEDKFSGSQIAEFDDIEGAGGSRRLLNDRDSAEAYEVAVDRGGPVPSLQVESLFTLNGRFEIMVQGIFSLLLRENGCAPDTSESYGPARPAVLEFHPFRTNRVVSPRCAYFIDKKKNRQQAESRDQQSGTLPGGEENHQPIDTNAPKTTMNSQTRLEDRRGRKTKASFPYMANLLCYGV